MVLILEFVLANDGSLPEHPVKNHTALQYIVLFEFYSVVGKSYDKSYIITLVKR